MTGRFFVARSFVALGLAGALSVVGRLGPGRRATRSATCPPRSSSRRVLEQGLKPSSTTATTTRPPPRSRHAVNALERAGAYAPGPLLLRAKAYAQLEEYEASLGRPQEGAHNTPRTSPPCCPRSRTRGRRSTWKSRQFTRPPSPTCRPRRRRTGPTLNINSTARQVAAREAGGRRPGRESPHQVPRRRGRRRGGSARPRRSACGARPSAPCGSSTTRTPTSRPRSLIDPDNHEAYFTRAQISLIKEDFADAIEATCVKRSRSTSPLDEERRFPASPRAT